MKILKDLFKKNKIWANNMRIKDPHFFDKLSTQQSPEILWIGCSDSRVPATEIVNMMPGEIFVHRNIANVVVHTDLNSLSVIQYAVEVLKVKHIIVCGHYDCGGVKASLDGKSHGLIDNWLRHIKDVSRFHQDKFKNLSHQEHVNRLCELNVVEQVKNICNTTIVQNAWRNDQKLCIHGWIYDIKTGILSDLDTCVESETDLSSLVESTK